MVRRRRMVRRYEGREVPRDKLLRILDAARRGPSAGFSQGLRLVAVTDRALRVAIADLADEDAYVAKGFEPWLSSAPVHVVLCVDEAAYSRRYEADDKAASDPEAWPVSYPVVDAGAGLMLLLLAAVDEGLAAGFLGVHRLDGLRELLGIPVGVVPIGLVTLGFPLPDRRSGSLNQGWKPLEEILSWEGWTKDP